MALRTVRVPPDVESLFESAERVVSRFFGERRDDPSRGTIEIFGERYLLVRAASLSVEFFELVRGLYGVGREAEADEFARNILYDLAHSVGRADARNFHAKMGLVDPVAKLSAGPIHFAHAGWAFVDIKPESKPLPTSDYVLHYDHPYSFESDAWLASGRTAAFPVCIMNAGYSSGWCSESFGMTLVAAEVRCRGRGEDTCRFVMAPPSHIEGYVSEALNTPERGRARPAFAPIPDFFARKRVEEDLRARFATELRDRIRAEAKLRDAQKLEAVGRLAGGVAHDFNNLMTVVIARASRLARRLSADDPMRAELEGIIEAGERASALTGHLLLFSRARLVPREPVAVDSTVESIVRVLETPAGEGTRVEFTPGATGAVVLMHRTQLEQVVMNLVANARDAMAGRGTVNIQTSLIKSPGMDGESGSSAVEIRVEDTGCGMDEETLAHLFEPYYSTKPGHGTGLGLATVYGIVQQAQGTIDVETAIGRGTRVKVRLHLHGMADATLERATVPRRERVRKGLRVVLVEDHEDVRGMLLEGLADTAEEVTVFADGLAALAMDEGTLQRAHALVTDVAMPGASGIEVALGLRRRRPELPVVFITGYAADPDQLMAVDGARVLTKPFRIEQLIDAIVGVCAAEVAAS